MATPRVPQRPPAPKAEPCRRAATRYEPTHHDACLSWRETPAEAQAEADLKTTRVDLPGDPEPGPRNHFALLLDISQTGAALVLDQVPGPDSEVWLRLEGESVTDWSLAEIVGVTTTSHGPHLVRLAFRGPCPFETLKSAVCG